ncbi:hypothetical protein DM450_20275 [Sphingomonas sp. IC081]|nr:hypothetical protein DM450_20275 [Sphingomonas sp. IC081]
MLLRVTRISISDRAMLGSRTVSAGLAGGVHAALLTALLLSWHAAPTSGPDARHGLTVMSLAAPQQLMQEAEPTQAAASRQVSRRAEASPFVRRQDVPPPLLVLPGTETPAALAMPGSADVPPSLDRSMPSDDAADSSRVLLTGTKAAAMPQTGSAASAAESPPTRRTAASDGYALRVFRHIRRYKAFPAALAGKGCEGTVLARFSLTREGRIDRLTLARSSGFGELDRLALEQLRQAAPFPKPPSSAAEAALSFLVPMTYRLEA